MLVLISRRLAVAVAVAVGASGRGGLGTMLVLVACGLAIPVAVAVGAGGRGGLRAVLMLVAGRVALAVAVAVARTERAERGVFRRSGGVILAESGRIIQPVLGGLTRALEEGCGRLEHGLGGALSLRARLLHGHCAVLRHGPGLGENALHARVRRLGSVVVGQGKLLLQLRAQGRGRLGAAVCQRDHFVNARARHAEVQARFSRRIVIERQPRLLEHAFDGIGRGSGQAVVCQHGRSAERTDEQGQNEGGPYGQGDHAIVLLALGVNERGKGREQPNEPVAPRRHTLRRCVGRGPDGQGHGRERQKRRAVCLPVGCGGHFHRPGSHQRSGRVQQRPELIGFVVELREYGRGWLAGQLSRDCLV